LIRIGFDACAEAGRFERDGRIDCHMPTPP
jgi:hypothetical protein